MGRKAVFLWGRVRSAGGLALLGASVSGSLAVGLLPELVREVPGVGGRDWWVAVVAVVAVVVLAYCWATLYYRAGVGIVLYFHEPGFDDQRLIAMEADARERHARCFTVHTGELLDGSRQTGAGDRVAFVHRVMQARLREEARGAGGDAGGVPGRSVSLYLTARLPETYLLGRRLKDQLHEELVLMGFSREAGVGPFPAVGLDSGLRGPPTAKDEGLLREVVRVGPGDAPDVRVFGTGPARYALILAVAGNAALVAQAQQAAASGGAGTQYDLNGRACAGALVIESRPGTIPDQRACYEALVRHVVYQWNEQVRRWSQERGEPVEGLLFTDAPGPIVTALGALIGAHTDLVPFRNRPIQTTPEGATTA